MKRLYNVTVRTFIITIFVILNLSTKAQSQYGNNAAVGHYVNVGDAKIYYEEYGSGSTIILLHGGIYGYIDEFSSLIPVLSKNHQVIAIATRGHGRSELGTRPLSYSLFAEDALKVISHINAKSVTVIGFSDGADAGYYLAAQNPRLVKQLIAIGGNFGYNDFKGGDKKFIDDLSPQSVIMNDPTFSTSRKALMPEPGRFNELIMSMAKLWREPEYVSKKTISSIITPTLIIAGQDDGCPIEKYIELYRLLPKGQIAVIPGSDHLVMERKPALTKQIILSFLVN